MNVHIDISMHMRQEQRDRLQEANVLDESQDHVKTTAKTKPM